MVVLGSLALSAVLLGIAPNVNAQAIGVVSTSSISLGAYPWQLSVDDSAPQITSREAIITRDTKTNWLCG